MAKMPHETLEQAVERLEREVAELKRKLELWEPDDLAAAQQAAAMNARAMTCSWWSCPQRAVCRMRIGARRHFAASGCAISSATSSIDPGPETDLSEPMADLGGQVIGDIPDDESVVTAENAHRLVTSDRVRLLRRSPSASSASRSGASCTPSGRTQHPGPAAIGGTGTHGEDRDPRRPLRVHRAGFRSARDQRVGHRCAGSRAQGGCIGVVRAPLPHVADPDAAARPRPAPRRTRRTDR